MDDTIERRLSALEVNERTLEARIEACSMGMFAIITGIGDMRADAARDITDRLRQAVATAPGSTHRSTLAEIERWIALLQR